MRRIEARNGNPPAGQTPQQPGRNGVKQLTKMVIRADKPDEPIPLSEAAAQIGVKPMRLYQSIHSGNKCNGVKFTWAPGHEPVKRPAHVGRKPRKATNPTADAPKPVKTLKAYPVTPGEPLTPHELAVLVGAMGASGSADAKLAEAVFKLGR